MSLYYLVFIIDCTWSDQSQQLNIVFNIDHTYTIDHIIALYGFHDRPHLV